MGTQPRIGRKQAEVYGLRYQGPLIAGWAARQGDDRGARFNFQEICYLSLGGATA
jgi:hypothetical protein